MIRRPVLLALLALLLPSTPACRMSNNSRTTLAVAGAAVAAGGVLIASQSDVDSDHDGENDVILNDNLGMAFMGGVMMLAGLGMMVGAAVSEPPEALPQPLAPAAPAPRIVATSPVSFPQLAVNGATVTSTSTPLRIDLAGWTIGQPYIVDGRTHVTAVATAASAQLELVLQRVLRPVTADEVTARLDLSSYGPMRRRASTIGVVPAVELEGATADAVPVLVTVAVADQQLFSVVCRGATPACRDAIARSTWASDVAPQP